MPKSQTNDIITKPEKKKKPKDTKRTIFIVVMLSYPIAHFLVFWLYMNLNTIILTFNEFDFNSGHDVFVGLKNYQEFFKQLTSPINSSLRDGIHNSLMLFPFNNFLVLPLTLVFSFFIFKKVLFYKAFRVIFFLPSIISVVVLTMIYQFMFNSSFGPVNKILQIVGLESVIPEFGWFGNTKTAWVMILFYCIWSGIGYSIILFSGAMSRIPEEVIESASLDGASLFRELWSIVIPMIFPVITTVTILNTAGMFLFFLQPRLLTGGGPNGVSGTMALTVMLSVESGYINWAATLGIVFSIIGVPIVLGIKYVMEKLVPSVEY